MFRFPAAAVFGLLLMARPTTATADDLPESEAEAALSPVSRWYAEADAGLFMTFGGRNAQDPNFGSKSVSSPEPYLAFSLGHHLVDGPTFQLGLGLKLAAAFSTGASRVTNEDVQNPSIDASTFSNDYSVYQTGAEMQVAWRFAESFAARAKMDFGLAILDPNPFVPASDAGAGNSTLGGVFGFGVGADYLTGIPGMSFGIFLRFVGVVGTRFIPAAAVTFPIKYAF
jgi:hypothetical protein